MTAFRLDEIHSDFFALYHGDRRVGIVFPARPATVFPPAPAEPWSIIPDPEAFPDAACVSLPRPLSPVGNRFDTFAEVEAFLGLRASQEAA